MTKNQAWIIILILIVIAGGAWIYISSQKSVAMSRAQNCFNEAAKQWSTIGQYPSAQARAAEIAAQEEACYTNEGLQSANYHIAVPTN